MPETPDAIVRRWFEEVWNQGRFETIDELYAADGVAHGLGEPGVDVTGPAGFRPFVERFRAAFPDIRITVDETITEGDRIAVRWTATLTHTGEGIGLPPTGKQVSVGGMTFVHVRNGQIARSWNNWDIAGLIRQLEAEPQQVTILE